MIMKRIVIIVLACALAFCFASCSDNSTDRAISGIVNLCNEKRAEEGLGALTLDENLSQNASVRAEETAREGCFSHIRPDGSGCFTAITSDYTAAGENLAEGKPDAQEIVSAWMASEAHRNNIMNRNFGKIGLAFYEKDGVYYLAALFTD
ncbi:MAG: hypothetical protein E7514_04640 [Ruminococcaceae bacterium]|nr:hypothetical protein [Oscillospiraceae bacterium]